MVSGAASIRQDAAAVSHLGVGDGVVDGEGVVDGDGVVVGLGEGLGEVDGDGELPARHGRASLQQLHRVQHMQGCSE